MKHDCVSGRGKQMVTMVLCYQRRLDSLSMIIYYAHDSNTFSVT